MTNTKRTREQLETALGAAESTLAECKNALSAVLMLEQARTTRRSFNWAEVMLSVAIANKCCEMYDRSHRREKDKYA